MTGWRATAAIAPRCARGITAGRMALIRRLDQADIG
jgi:hypothetical protein